jgi:hypothetical protein
MGDKGRRKEEEKHGAYKRRDREDKGERIERDEI